MVFTSGFHQATTVIELYSVIGIKMPFSKVQRKTSDWGQIRLQWYSRVEIHRDVYFTNFGNANGGFHSIVLQKTTFRGQRYTH